MLVGRKEAERIADPGAVGIITGESVPNIDGCIKKSMNEDELRYRLLESLETQGFQLRDGLIVPFDQNEKPALRSIHAAAVRHQIERSAEGLRRHEPRLLSYIAAGDEVAPEDIVIRLAEVHPDSDEELLFRYARLHWSIPVSSGYGRRVRFLIFDDSNGKLIGLIGLGDPVYNLSPRDSWIGWNSQIKRARLKAVMDAFVLGAVPPYSYLLAGKLVALLTASDEVCEAVQRKYGDRPSRMTGTPQDGQLALITTTSALGRSSIYNRLRFKTEPLFISVGFTRGSGEFHFANGFYEEIQRFALENCKPTAKDPRWGSGFRNRRELIRKVLQKIGLPRDLIYHGVQREIFVAPLARNCIAFLRGEEEQLIGFNRPAKELFDWYRERWLLPRSVKDHRYRSFKPTCYRLWEKG